MVIEPSTGVCDGSAVTNDPDCDDRVLDPLAKAESVGLLPRAQVDQALAAYADLPPIPLDETITPETFYQATPDRLAFALGWVAANQIVQARFVGSAIDALPVFHPEHGWDRFLLGRRVSGAAFKYQPANEFGMLMLSGDGAPRLTTPGGTTRLPLGDALRSEPEAAIQELLALIPRPAVGASADNRVTKREQAPHYPAYFNAVTELILEHPGLTAAREIFVDDQPIDGQYHPLHLHAVDLLPEGKGINAARMTHNWFQLQHGDMFAFFDRRGSRAVYRTERGTWSRVRVQLNEEPDERIKPRIAGWLRLDGAAPDPERD